MIETYSLLDPDHHFLAFINHKKLKWYLKKSLGVLQDKNLILNFYPEKNSLKDKEYYNDKIDSKCVICGTRESLVKHHVVPRCFRKFFPVEIKNYNSHDVLILCHPCHELYETHASKFKSFLIKRLSKYEQATSRNIYLEIVESIGINKLSLQWREHFVRYGKPKFLPSNWNVKGIT